jgi:stage II sporulation protein D
MTVADGALGVVDSVPLELYLRGVVPSEMPRGWQPAAYEAQSVVARTYALSRLGSRPGYDLVATADDQVYGGIAAEQPATNAAIGATAGQVVTYGGHVITAYYSASTGGRTEAVQDAFPGRAPEPYLVSVPDPFDAISPLHHWLVALTAERLARKLGFDPIDLRVDHDAAGRATQVTVSGPRGTHVVAAAAFRDALGLRSTDFSIHVLSLDPPTGAVGFGSAVALGGFVRGVGGVSLETLTPAASWSTCGRPRPPDTASPSTVSPGRPSRWRWRHGSSRRPTGPPSPARSAPPSRSGSSARSAAAGGSWRASRSGRPDISGGRCGAAATA